MKKTFLFLLISSVIMLSTLTSKSQNDTIRVSARFDSIAQIPDGYDINNPQYYKTITISSFPQGASVTSGSDIRSLSINMEHSYGGDLSIALVCPNGQKTILKYYLQDPYYGLGLSIKDSVYNTSSSTTYGQGWTYCFSNQILNATRGVLGKNSSCSSIISPYDSTETITTIDSSDYSSDMGFFQTPFQPSTTSQEPSDSLKNATYLSGFDQLIGCPLNGNWHLVLKDNRGLDNGFVFWWRLELQHPIESSIKEIDSSNTTLKAYPIPSKGKVYIDAGKEKIESVTLTTIEGKSQMIKTQKNDDNTLSIDLSSYPCGTYLLTAKSASQNHSIKVVKTE